MILCKTLCKDRGRKPKTKQLKGKALRDQLFEKLTEEHAELLATETPDATTEEIADMIEVLLSLAKTAGHTEEQTIDFLHKKRSDKGGFDDGIFLEDIDLAA